MNSIKIYIHSFIDLITNSSSETFIQSTNQTVKSVKELIQVLLALGGDTTSQVDDLFDIYLVSDQYDETKDDWILKRAKYKNDGESKYYLKVVAKDKTNELAKKSAEILSGLKDFFEASEVSC